MKKSVKILSLVGLLLMAVVIVTGCEKKEEKQVLNYDGEKLKASFEIAQDLKARLSTEGEDTRTSRETAIILADDFKIGIEENDDLAFSNYSGDFDKYKKAHEDGDNYKETKYNNMDAFVQYYGGYVRYEVYLKVSDKYILKLNVYSTKDTEEETKKQFDSEVVQNILKSVKVEVK